MAGRNVARAKMAGSTNIRGKMIFKKIGCSSSRLLRTRLPQSIIERYEMICILYCTPVSGLNYWSLVRYICHDDGWCIPDHLVLFLSHVRRFIINRHILPLFDTLSTPQSKNVLFSSTSYSYFPSIEKSK